MLESVSLTDAHQAYDITTETFRAAMVRVNPSISGIFMDLQNIGHRGRKGILADFYKLREVSNTKQCSKKSFDKIVSYLYLEVIK